MLPELERLILSCLAKAPAERPGNAAELEIQLMACPDPEPWTAQQAELWWQRLEAQKRDEAQPTALSGTALTVDIQRHAQAAQ